MADEIKPLDKYLASLNKLGAVRRAQGRLVGTPAGQEQPTTEEEGVAEEITEEAEEGEET